MKFTTKGNNHCNTDNAILISMKLGKIRSLVISTWGVKRSIGNLMLRVFTIFKTCYF